MSKNELIILIKTVITSINIMCRKGECTVEEAVMIANRMLTRWELESEGLIMTLKDFAGIV